MQHILVAYHTPELHRIVDGAALSFEGAILSQRYGSVAAFHSDPACIDSAWQITQRVVTFEDGKAAIQMYPRLSEVQGEWWGTSARAHLQGVAGYSVQLGFDAKTACAYVNISASSTTITGTSEAVLWLPLPIAQSTLRPTRILLV